MTELCSVAVIGDRILIDPKLVPMEKAKKSANRLNKLYRQQSHMAVDVWQLALLLYGAGVDGTESSEIANDVFSGKITEIFVVFYKTGRIANWAES